jgi:hypothetical protein
MPVPGFFDTALHSDGGRRDQNITPEVIENMLLMARDCHLRTVPQG